MMWRRAASRAGTALIGISLVWMALWLAYGSLSSGLIRFETGAAGVPETAQEPARWVHAGPVQEPASTLFELVPGPAASQLVDLTALTGSDRGAPPAVPRAYPPAVQILIPSIEVDAPVVEIGLREDAGRLVWETAKWAVGHHKGTPNPGQAGNIVMSGHIRSPVKQEGNVFSRLPQLGLDETIILVTEEAEFRYRTVERRIVTPQQVNVMDPTPGPQLTLITCFPDWIYSHRLVLTAVPE